MTCLLLASNHTICPLLYYDSSCEFSSYFEILYKQACQELQQETGLLLDNEDYILLVLETDVSRK